LEEVVRHLRFVLFRRLHFVCHGVLEELANELVDSTVKSCGEEQALTFPWCLFKNASHVLKEAKLGHVIGFVQDGALHCVEFNLSGLHEVNEATWACNNDVDTIAHCVDLAGVAHAAVHSGGTHTECISEGNEYVTYLVCKFTCWHQDDGTRTETVARLVALVKASEHRKTKREGLARSGAATAEGVTTRKSVGNCCLLDGERCQNSLRCQDIN
jgi:hypothetical protein